MTDKTKIFIVYSLTNTAELNKDPFCVNLWKILVSVNISLKKLNVKHFKLLLENKLAKKIPHESTIRKNYLNVIAIY